MTIKRIKDFPEGSGTLSNDDIFLFMDNPSGSGITKKVSLSVLSSIIGQDTLIPTVYTINDASGNISTDVGTYSIFNINLSDSGNLSAPSNASDGQRCLWRIKRIDGEILTLHNNFRVINSGVIDNSSHTTTFIDGVYDSYSNRWDSILYNNLPAIAPSAPSGVIGFDGNQLVHLSWNAPADDGGVAIIDYIIQYSADSGTSWNTFDDGIGTSLSATVTGLINDTSYIFRVAAQNSIDIGPYSDPSDNITPTDNPYHMWMRMDASPFIDSSNVERTISSVSSTTLDTSNKQVGDGSLSVDQNGYLYTTDTADIDISGDFTIDFWLYPTGVTGLGYSIPLSTSLNTTANGLFMSWGQFGSGSLSVGRAAVANYATSDTGVAPLSQWTHIVITRSSNVIKIFANDTLVASDTSSYAFQCPQINIGDGDNPGAGAGFIGNIDEFKILCGVALDPS